MAEPHDHILDRLKSMQKQLSDIRGAISDLSTDMRGVKGHQAGFMPAEVAQDGRIADLTSRLERIEHRLELREQ
jgi:hypothetical protein